MAPEVSLAYGLHVLKYGSLTLYSIGLVGFFLFALSLLRTSVKHFFVTILAGIFWPASLIFFSFRKKKANKAAPKYIYKV